MSEPAPPGVKRVLSGIRPSGALHLGQYAGVLQQWLALQADHECFFMIADVQALTTHLEQPEVIAESVREVALDWLAVGIDPEQSNFFLQSQIPEFAELTVYLQMLVQTGELRRNPTTRDEARALGRGNLHDALNEVGFGFLGYPVAQVADTLLFTTSPPQPGDALIVPVGADQLPHVELARELARRFNAIYGTVFLEPEARLARVPRLPGIDGGSKMGKSARNAIFLKDPEEEYTRKIQAMFTDPLRARPEDPGHPDECPCYAFLQAFGLSRRGLQRRRDDCLAARTDCEDCKEDLVAETRRLLAPIQARRADFAQQPELLKEILTEGTRRAAVVARATIGRVRDAMKLTYPGLIAEGR